MNIRSVAKVVSLACAAAALSACSILDRTPGARPQLPTAQLDAVSEAPLYIIGPLDSINVFVWRNPDLTSSVTVRPDGRVTLPLIGEIIAAGKTPTELAQIVEEEMQRYIQQPIVSISVNGFSGQFNQQVRILGEAINPQSIPFRANMTLIDVMIAVGGLTDFAAGNRTTLIRVEDGVQREYRLRINALIRDGDVGANVQIMPGDVIIIPESLF